MASAAPSVGSVPAPNSSNRHKEFSSAFCKIETIVVMWEEKVLKDCSILCSSPISAKILSKTLLKGKPSSFILELPPYRKPQLSKILVRSLIDRTLFVLLRAIYIAIPAGVLIWSFANIYIGGSSILFYIASFLEPFASLIGLDGYILAAFILAIPANEIVLPILLMGYLSSSTLISLDEISNLKNILLFL